MFFRTLILCGLVHGSSSAASFFDQLEKPAGETQVFGVNSELPADVQDLLQDEAAPFIPDESALNSKQLQILRIFQDIDLPLAPEELLNSCEEDGGSWTEKIVKLTDKLKSQGFLKPGEVDQFSVLNFLGREFPVGELAKKIAQFQVLDRGFSGFNEICHAPEPQAGVQNFSAPLLPVGYYADDESGSLPDAPDASSLFVPEEATETQTDSPAADAFLRVTPPRGRFYRPGLFSRTKEESVRPVINGEPSVNEASRAPETAKAKSAIGRQWEKITDFLEPANLKEEIKQKIAEMDVGFDIKMLDVEAFAGVGLSSKYRYEVKPSYEKDFYTRVDGWELKLKLKPGDWVPEYELPISLTMDNGIKINFVRQFESQREAAKALPYSPKRLPFRAESVIKYLEPGDFVSLPAHMNVVVNAGLSTTEGIFTAGANTHYLMSGEFQVHVYRMKDDKVRLKLIAQRKRQKGVSGSVKMDFKIFGIKIVDKQVKKLLDMNLANFGVSATEGNLFVLDYIFDLRNEEAAQAYDRILGSSLKFKNLEVLNPFLSNRELSEQIIGDVTAAEQLFVADREKEPVSRRVDRIFKGLNDYSQKATNFKIGINLLKFQRDRVFTSNYLTYYDVNDQATEFYYPAYSVQKKRKFLFGALESSEVDSVFGLFECDENRNVVRFSDYGFSYELKDNVSRRTEQSALKEDIMRSISPDLYSQVQWGDWEKEERRSNARLSMQIVLRPEALEAFSRLTEDDIYSRLAIFISALPELPDPHNEHTYGSNTRPGCYVSRRWSEAKKTAARVACVKNYNGYWRSMIRMVESLHSSFAAQDGINQEERISEFMDMRKNWAFRMMGTGLLISLIPPADREKAIQVSLRWSAKKTETLEFSYGDTSKSNFYNDLQYILSILNNRSIDLRLNERELEFREKEIQAED